MNFDVLGDASATYSAAQVAEAMLTSKPGSIILAHMNRLASGTAEGIKKALPEPIAGAFGSWANPTICGVDIGSLDQAGPNY